MVTHSVDTSQNISPATPVTTHGLMSKVAGLEVMSGLKNMNFQLPSLTRLCLLLSPDLSAGEANTEFPIWHFSLGGSANSPVSGRLIILDHLHMEGAAFRSDWKRHLLYF